MKFNKLNKIVILFVFLYLYFPVSLYFMLFLKYNNFSNIFDTVQINVKCKILYLLNLMAERPRINK